MSFAWYEQVPHNTTISQGDLLRDCPVIGWSDDLRRQAESPEQLLGEAESVDCIVMSQACDLEQGHLRNVIACPMYTLAEYRPLWEQAVTASRQNPTEKNWRRWLDEISAGRTWNLAMINAHAPAEAEALRAEVMLVDFHEILSLPRIFLESWALRVGLPRLRLLPPYREHLSQAFARYFMRVGLPVEIERNW
jgi:hypothetical protein